MKFLAVVCFAELAAAQPGLFRSLIQWLFRGSIGPQQTENFYDEMEVQAAVEPIRMPAFDPIAEWGPHMVTGFQRTMNEMYSDKPDCVGLDWQEVLRHWIISNQ